MCLRSPGKGINPSVWLNLDVRLGNPISVLHKVAKSDPPILGLVMRLEVCHLPWLLAIIVA
jgi:hypothetical protein